MDFRFSEEQLAIKQLAKDFSQQEFAPLARQWDREAIFPIDVLQKAAALGFGGIIVDPNVGGSGLTRVDACLIFSELAKSCVSTAAYLSIHNMVNTLIDRFAHEDLRQQWCPQLSSMQILGGYCLTEPNSGSDAASLTTRAEKVGSDYVINGSKCFISGGNAADVFVVMVRTGEPGPKGISCVLVEKDTPGVSFGELEKKLGWNSQPTTTVFFENCKIPQSQLIGEEGQGFSIALTALNGGRVNIAACSIGGASTCLQEALSYVKSREQFGKPIAQFQHTQFTLADMLTELEAAKLMMFRAACGLDEHDPKAPELCAMAKRFATDVGFQICDNALQLHGGYGYLKSYSIERFFRDCRVHRILEGTNEIMRLIIAKRMLSEDFQLM